MTIGFRNPLGKSLAGMILPGDQPDMDWGDFPPPTATPQPRSGGLFKPGSKGQIIAGIIGDTLATLAGRSPVFTQNLMQQRQREEEMQRQDVQWTRRREAEREDKRWEWENKPETTSEFDRLAKAAGIIPGSPQWTQANKRRLENMLNPSMAVQTVDANGDPALTFVPKNPTAFSSDDVPTVSDEAGYNALPDGARYRDPSGALRTKGGAAAPASPPFGNSGFVPPQALKSGRMTSGRRTSEGNTAVGGVDGSKHLTGEAADYWGSDLGAVLAEVQGLPGVRRAFIHGKGNKRHVHGEGAWNAPYFGRNGTRGLRTR